MPWKRNRSRFSDDIGPLQKTLNVAFVLIIILFFLIFQAYRTSLDTMKAEVASLKGDVSTMVQGNGGDGDVSAVTDDVLRDVSDLREQLAALGERVETLASKSVDVRSMEGLRDEMLATRDRLTSLESGVEAIEASASEGQDVPAGDVKNEDIEAALAEARAAQEELRAFKTLLGYDGL